MCIRDREGGSCRSRDDVVGVAGLVDSAPLLGEVIGPVGVAGLIPAKPGPKRPTKLTAAVVARIRELDADGQTLTAIAAAAKVSIATVRVALGRPSAGAGRSARPGRDPQPAGPPPSAVAPSALAGHRGR